MSTVYKLTDQNMQTHSGYQWSLGEWKETSGKGGLCGPGWLHCYSDPVLAVMLNPIHADIGAPRLFEAEAEGAMLDDSGLKAGYARMRLLRELPLPEVTTEARVRFAILCASVVCDDVKWRDWAERWLGGTDRSAAAAAAEAGAAEAAWAAAGAAWAAARAAARAAEAAAELATDAGGCIGLSALARKAVADEKAHATRSTLVQ